LEPLFQGSREEVKIFRSCAAKKIADISESIEWTVEASFG
jgi:hypothetical protein